MIAIRSAPTPEDDKSADARRIVGIVQTQEDWWQRHRAEKVARNLAFYRGEFWKGDGFAVPNGDAEQYRAERNEVSPVVDTIVSALAMDLPQVEVEDRRQRSVGLPTRNEDSTMAGRRLAAVLNWFAEADELEVATQEMVLHAAVFDEGGTIKTTWSPVAKRIVWRTMLPWEVFFDPTAKRLRDAGWSFERFVLHVDDLQRRVDEGTYTLQKGIKADTYPRSLVDDELDNNDEQELRLQGLREYVNLVEWWDYRKGLVLHVHPESAQVLMSTPLPYRRPYSRLIFRSGVSRARGISDVTLMANMQRDINELVSARREIVNRLPKRMMIDRGLFSDDKDFERFKNSRSWEPSLVDLPPDGSFEGRVYTTPAMDTTFDFNKHLADDIEHSRWLTGVSEHDRGRAVNIRTAEEAKLIRGGEEGRMNIRSRRVMRAVIDLFEAGREVVRWAVLHPEASAIDLEALWDETQVDVSIPQFADELVNASTKFRLMPFNSIMENKIEKRESLATMLPALTQGALAEVYDPTELGRELADLFGWRPSIVRKAPPPVPAVAPGGAAPGLDAAPTPGGDPMAALAALAANG